MTDIDWSKAPEGYPIWIQDLRPEVGTDLTGWHRKESDRYYDQEGRHWLEENEGKWFAVHRRVDAWSGEGLPPVGTVCMTTDNDKELEVKILAYADGADGRDYVMVCEMLGDLEDQLHAWVAQMCTFSPIKTPEQIAAEEREREIEALAADIISEQHKPWRVIAERLHALGYRKVEGGAK